MDIENFKAYVDSALNVDNNALQAEQFPGLMETVLSDVKDNMKDEGLKYLAEKAKGVIPKSVLDVIENSDTLKGDTEALLAVATNGLSQSLNSLALDVTRRNIHGSDEEDFFAKPMDRLTKGLIGKLQLRGVMNEIGINVTDGDDTNHWTSKLFGEAKSLAEFRNMDWKDISEKVKGINVQDKSRLEQLFTGKLGPKVGVEHIPKIREQLRSKNVNLGIASEFEKKDKKNITDLTKSDIDTFEFEGIDNMRKVEKNEMRNNLKSIVSDAQKEEEQTKKKKMTNEEAFAIGQKIKGGPEVLKGLDDLADIAPLISEVGGLGGPEVALAIAATKILAQEGQNRQKEADEMMQASQKKAQEARDEAFKLMEALDVKLITKEQKEQLKKDLDLIKSKVKESASFDAVGQHFNSKKLLNDLEDNALKLPSAEGGAIESYSSNEKLVASVSGGMTLHGISLLLGEYPIESVSTPILKEPSYVEVYGVDQPFTSSVFKCTKEMELSTFHKTATSGGMSMAESTSSSTSHSTSMKYTTFIGAGSSESTSGTSSAEELARSKKWEEESSTEKDLKIKKAFLSEYIKMPMRCVRIPYDSMRLSEDTKRDISKMSTLLEAYRFLRTFGSHLSCGDYILGGVFFRTIAMESETEKSSVTMFSAAGNTLSHELSSGKTSTKSGGGSFGLFGLGPKISSCSTSDTAEKTMNTSHEENSDGSGTNTASNSYSYSVNVSSLGPNANTSAEFFRQLNTNTGTWSVIDKGGLDHVIPVWDLIRDELFEEKKFKAIQEKVSSVEADADKAFMKQQRQILKSCRLLKRAWATKTREFLESPSPPRLPDTIMHTITDFIKVDKNIGSMVNCICSLVIPNISKVQDQGLRGNRLSMLKSLQTLVRSAKEVYLEDSFSYDNWFVKDLLKAGQKRLESLHNESQKDMTFPAFDVAPHDDMIGENGASVSMEIRMMHANAVECAQNLSIDAWEDLCDEFVNLARVVKMPYFHSAEDKERTAKVWNLTSSNGCKHTAYLQTPIDTVELEAMEGKAVYCPDAVSPINVYAVPPLAYDSNWKWYDILSANKVLRRKLYPGVTYYLVREKNFGGKKIVENAEFLTESAMLQNGWTIIENTYSCDVKLQFFEDESNKVDLHGRSVYLIDKFNAGKKISVSSYSTGPASKPIDIVNGKKFFVNYLNEDALYTSTPVLVEPREKLIDEKRNKGSLLLSNDGKRRMHVWQNGNFPLNTLTEEGCKDFCLDQFWSFDPVEGPKFPGEMYEPDEKVFAITSKKSKGRLYAKLQEYGTEQDDFGLIPNEVDIDDSQKWQILEGYLVDNVESKGGDKYYYIVNAHSDRFLGLQDEGDSKLKLNRVIAATADEALLDVDSMKKFQWLVAPWAILLKQITGKIQNEEQNGGLIQLPQDIHESLPNKKIILKRNSLPAQSFLADGGIIISNPYPKVYTVKWSGENNGFNLMPNSKVFLPPPKNVKIEEATISINSMKELPVKTGVVYTLYYDEDDPLCLGVPNIVSQSEINEAKAKRKGYYLIYTDEDGKILRLGGISKRGDIGMGLHSDNLSYLDQLWSIEPTSKSKRFYLSDRSQHLLGLAAGNSVKALPDNKKCSTCMWTLETIPSENSKVQKCTIKNTTSGHYLQYLDDCQKCVTGKRSEGSFWTIIKKDDINSDEVKEFFYGTAQASQSIGFQDTLQSPNVPILDGLTWYPNSFQWRLLGKDCKNNVWDVESIAFFDPFEQPIEVDLDKVFASGSYNDSDWGPKNPFLSNNDGWGGLSNGNNQFYIGMKFDKAVRVGFVTVRLRGVENVPKTIELQFSYSKMGADVTEWRTITKQEVSIDKDLGVKLKLDKKTELWGDVSVSFPITKTLPYPSSKKWRIYGTPIRLHQAWDIQKIVFNDPVGKPIDVKSGSGKAFSSGYYHRGLNDGSEFEYSDQNAFDDTFPEKIWGGRAVRQYFIGMQFSDEVRVGSVAVTMPNEGKIMKNVELQYLNEENNEWITVAKNELKWPGKAFTIKLEVKQSALIAVRKGHDVDVVPFEKATLLS